MTPYLLIDACDCHVHVYDSRYPAAPGAAIAMPTGGTLTDYQDVQQTLGIARVVIVTPSTYGADNRATLDALETIGLDARGVAVIDPQIDDAALGCLHAAGIRGVRINAMQRGAAAFDDMERVCSRIAPLGWHLQLFGAPQLWAELHPRLAKLPVPLVFDHFGNIPPAGGTDHAAFDVVTRFMKDGKGWVKLSGAMNISSTGAPDYADVDPLARAYLAAEPSRVVWGTDWPHPAMQLKPDDAHSMRALQLWCDDDAGLLQKILGDNPAHLYDFDAAG